MSSQSTSPDGGERLERLACIERISHPHLTPLRRSPAGLVRSEPVSGSQPSGRGFADIRAAMIEAGDRITAVEGEGHRVEKPLGQIRGAVAPSGEAHDARFLFPAPSTPAVPVRGRAGHVPIRRIFCVGRNYEAHAREMGVAVDRDAPFYFTKAAQHYAPSGSTVPYPPGTSSYHYELELVAVIGAPAFRVPADRALEYVFGYACGLDMTRRDLQQAAKDQRRPWDLGKDFEGSAVLAEIVPAADIGHPSTGAIELRVNGKTKQQSDLSLLIHGVREIVAHLSTFYHLQPGDLIYTGTPEGVGPVSSGDHLEGSIAGLGSITLTVGAPV